MGFRKTAVSTNTATAIDQAENGLSVINPAPGDYRSVLGNDVGSTLAQLTSDREIPTNGNDIFFTGSGQMVIGSTTPAADLTIDRFSGFGNASLDVRGLSATITIGGFSGNALLTFIGSIQSEMRVPSTNFFISNPSAMPVVGSYNWFTITNSNHTQQTGTGNGVISQQAFRPLAGNAVFNAWNLADTIDQTAGATGITRLLYINPSLFGTPADLRALEIGSTLGRAIYQTSAVPLNALMGLTGFGEATPIARVHIGAGTTSIGQLLMAPGALVSPMVNGMVENDGTFLYYTAGGVRSRIATAAVALGNDRLVFTTGSRISDSANLQYSNTNVSLAVGGAATNANCFFILSAGTTAKAPARILPGVVTTTIVDGNVENDGTNFFVSQGGVRYTLAKTLTATATLDFPNTAAGDSADLTIALTGAVAGDIITVGAPIASYGTAPSNQNFTGFVSAPGVVTVRHMNCNAAGSFDPPSGQYRVSLTKY